MLEGDAINVTICSFFSWNCGVMVIAYKHKLLYHEKKPAKKTKQKNSEIKVVSLGSPLELVIQWEEESQKLWWK